MDLVTRLLELADDYSARFGLMPQWFVLRHPKRAAESVEMLEQALEVGVPLAPDVKVEGDEGFY